jgi:nickel transport protein
MKRQYFLSAFITLVIPVMVSAHGIQVNFEMKSPVVIIKASYSAALQISDASVIILSPADPQNPYQKGRTDISGFFAFRPDREGDWTILVDDQKGHSKKTIVTITPDFFSSEHSTAVVPASIHEHETEHTHDADHIHTDDKLQQNPDDHSPAAIPSIYKIIFGLALIFGISGIFYGLRAGKQNK